MADKKVFIVTDLGGGDGGKGGVVHKICVQNKAHTVVKVGGAQGSHGVRTSAGQSFNFSQFGCGTFEGSRTHISHLMVIEPYRLIDEAERLQHEWGIKNIYDYLTIDGRALCVTPYHTMASRLRELDRKHDPKGTVGVGVGEAWHDSEIHPELAIYAADLTHPDLHAKIQLVRTQKLTDLESILSRIDSLLPEDSVLAQECIELLHDEGFVDRIVKAFNHLGTCATVVDASYLEEQILSLPGTVVFETSHGILTDKYHGFHPHTTKLRTLPNRIVEVLEQCGYDGEIFKLGITRGYQIRHGAGPMVTESPNLLEALLPGSNKDENRWQGRVRVGPLDLVALRYAIEVCGGPSFFDGLAITWFDQIQVVGAWELCNRYSGADDRTYFSPTGEIVVRVGSDDEQLQYQQQLGNKLRGCRPEIESYSVKDMSQDEVLQLCSDMLYERLGVPVVMVSFGPTETHKVCVEVAEAE